MTLLAPKAEMLKVKTVIITLEHEGFHTNIQPNLYPHKYVIHSMRCLNLFYGNNDSFQTYCFSYLILKLLTGLNVPLFTMR